ncbi:MAG: hypothetical protein HY824_13985 [Acidobacteria bacterium]|nr:hypothetical protein [Acidobacteriota bacterium]
MAHDEVLAHGHGSADDEYRETPPDSTYEHTDAHAWVIVKFLIWLAVSAVIVHFGLGVVYQLLIDRSMETAQPYPLATTVEERLPPAPRLQQFPRNELYQFRLDENVQLERYGWMNKDAGTVHIPIEDAMRLTLERGALQSRTPDGTAPVETPGLMPSDSSAGRVMERRRQ